MSVYSFLLFNMYIFFINCHLSKHIFNSKNKISKYKLILIEIHARGSFRRRLIAKFDVPMLIESLICVNDCKLSRKVALGDYFCGEHDALCHYLYVFLIFPVA